MSNADMTMPNHGLLFGILNTWARIPQSLIVSLLMEHVGRGVGRARKRLTAAIDGLRNNLQNTFNPSSSEEFEIAEKLEPDALCFSRLRRYGFPHDPRCLAFDPIQKLCAIGAGRGCIRILGQAGVDHHLKHDSDEPVTRVQFLINEGGLITILNDDSIHLWNFRQKTPEIVHSIQLNRERISAIHLPLQSRWLYVGTDKGNVYFVCLATFELSTYVINWNKAVDLSCRVHPGPIRLLSVSTSEPSKLLIVFKKAGAILWNLLTREAERFGSNETSPVVCVCWHHDGRQLMCGHADGSLTIWNLKKPGEVIHKTIPHSPSDSDVQCRPITHLVWSTNVDNEQLIIFSGGMPADDGVLPSLTILRAKGSLTVLEMDYSIVEVLPMFISPYPSLSQHPYALAVLLKNDILVVDINAQGYPCFETPYPMDIHESTVTYLRYYVEFPTDLIAALTLVGRNQRHQGVRLSERNWPVSGGIAHECATGFQEMLLTGHEDGSIKFWNSSGEQLQVMYKLKTGRHFEKNASYVPPIPPPAADGENLPAADKLPTSPLFSHAVSLVELCPESRLLLVASASGQVTLFRFVKVDGCQEIAVIVLSQLCQSTSTGSGTPPLSPPDTKPQPNEQKQQSNKLDQAGLSSPPATTRDLKVQTEFTDSRSTDTSMGSQLGEQMPLKVRGALRRPAGYQPEFVCLIPWVNGQPEQLTVIALNSAIGVAAISSSVGLAVVDILSASLIYFSLTSDLSNCDPASFPPLQIEAKNDISPPLEVSAKPLKSPSKFTTASQKTPFITRLNTTDSGSSIRPPLTKAFTFNPSTSSSETQTMLSPPVLMPNASPIPLHCNGGDANETPAATLSGSSSAASLEKISATNCDDFVTAITFINSFPKSGAKRQEPCIWVGTSVGTCVALNLVLPANRLANQISVTSYGHVVRMCDQMLLIAFMDRKFCFITATSDSYREPKEAINSGNLEKQVENKVITRESRAPMIASSQENEKPASLPEEISQLALLVSEQEAKVVGFLAADSNQLLFCHQFYPVPIVKAKTSHIKGIPVLLCLNAAGTMLSFTLPALKPLFQASLFPFSIETDDPICQRFDTSEHGLGMFMSSPSEVTKFTMSSDLARQIADCSGELFIPRDMPEAPKQSFLREVSSILIGGIVGAPKQEVVNFNELFGEKPSTSTATVVKTVARQITSSAQPATIYSNMERAEGRSVTAAQALHVAMQNIGERGERLGAVADASENLRNSAQSLQSRASKIVEKYEKKKWYQF